MVIARPLWGGYSVDLGERGALPEPEPEPRREPEEGGPRSSASRSEARQQSSEGSATREVAKPEREMRRLEIRVFDRRFLSGGLIKLESFTHSLFTDEEKRSVEIRVPAPVVRVEEARVEVGREPRPVEAERRIGASRIEPGASKVEVPAPVLRERILREEVARGPYEPIVREILARGMMPEPRSVRVPAPVERLGIYLRRFEDSIEGVPKWLARYIEYARAIQREVPAPVLKRGMYSEEFLDELRELRKLLETLREEPVILRVSLPAPVVRLPRFETVYFPRVLPVPKHESSTEEIGEVVPIRLPAPVVIGKIVGRHETRSLEKAVSSESSTEESSTTVTLSASLTPIYLTSNEIVNQYYTAYEEVPVASSEQGGLPTTGGAESPTQQVGRYGVIATGSGATPPPRIEAITGKPSISTSEEEASRITLEEIAI